MAELADLLRGVADGTPPPTDSELTVVQPPDERSVGVLAFPGQNIIVADVRVEWVRSWLASEDLGEPFSPPFLSLLSAVTGRAIGNIDSVLVGRAHGRRRGLELTEITDSDHPRVVRAKRHRDDVRAWACPGGLLVVGRGVAGRWEAAVEVDAAVRGFGLGRGLFAAALGLLPEGESVWAQVAPGNAASLRALLAAGYRPVGGEVLLAPRADPAEGEPVEWFASYLPVDDWQGDPEPIPESVPESVLGEPVRGEVPAHASAVTHPPAHAAPHVATHAAADPPEATPTSPASANSAPGAPASAGPAPAAPAPAGPALGAPAPASSTPGAPAPATPAPASAASAGSASANPGSANPGSGDPDSGDRAVVAPELAGSAHAEPGPVAQTEQTEQAEPSSAGSAGAEGQRAEAEPPFEPVYVRLPPIDAAARAPRAVGGEKRPIETHASAEELAAAEADAEAELDADEDTELAERDEPPS